eukprot:4280366-Pleurochrysis_carterae.AAC.2
MRRRTGTRTGGKAEIAERKLRKEKAEERERRSQDCNKGRARLDECADECRCKTGWGSGH